MDFVVDNAVALSAILMGVFIIGGLVVLGLTGWMSWKVVRAARTRVEAASAELAAEGDRLQESLTALPDRQAELEAAIASLSRRTAALGVLAASAGNAAQVLRAPLRYIGR